MIENGVMRGAGISSAVNEPIRDYSSAEEVVELLYL